LKTYSIDAYIISFYYFKPKRIFPAKTAKFTRGRVTIPAELRKKYNIHPGTKVKFVEEKDGVRIIPLSTPEEIRANIGFLGKNGKLLEALMEEKMREREL
jgi:AbrB family looped-hinge helix DNA binding protein